MASESIFRSSSQDPLGMWESMAGKISENAVVKRTLEMIELFSGQVRAVNGTALH